MSKQNDDLQRNADLELSKWNLSKKLLKEIGSILEQNNKTAAHGRKSVSPNTQKNRKGNVLGFFSILINKSKFKIESVMNLKEKHLDAVFNYLQEQGLNRGSIRNMLTSMRTFCKWIGKGGMVRELSHYLKNTPLTIAPNTDVGKTPQSNAINPMAVLAAIRALKGGTEERVALWLELCLAFAIDISVCLMVRPVIDINGNALHVRKSTRGGRKVFHVRIENEAQRAVLEKAKLFAKKKAGRIGRLGKKLAADMNHFYYVLRKVGITKKDNGVTVNGLRLQYLKQVRNEPSGNEPPAINKFRNNDVALNKSEQIG